MKQKDTFWRDVLIGALIGVTTFIAVVTVWLMFQ